MPALTVNQIRRNLSAFSKQWKDASRENADAKLFWARFYECFGIRPESATIYEKAVQKLGGGTGFIDSFIPGKLIVEHKSRGKSLGSAFDQAADYYLALSEAERPRYIITSDFARFRLHDLRSDTQHECTLANLSGKAQWFTFLLEDDAPEILEESPINRQAAYAVSRLHEALLRGNFKGRALEIFLTRLLFCLFADDTGIFGANGQFRRIVEATRADGRDTGARLSELFDVLNTADSERQANLDEALASFNYINGSLFAERTRIPAFDATLRTLLVECAVLDWSSISPAIFGAMFQGVLDAHDPDEKRQATRRELGAHYTSERNILRVVNPLCMDSLREEFEAAKRNKPRLQALYDKLPTLTFLDPACGCGNFLVIAFRELRRIENEIIAALFGFGHGRGLLDVATLCRVKVSQFYGIEIDESAAHIARVAMWITDHQMNLEAAQRFGTSRPTVPLVDSPTIVCGNALHIDWASVLPPDRCSFVLGNPPFVGKKEQTPLQKADMAATFVKAKGAGVLDYVAAWYVKAMAYIKDNPTVEVAFVSTNSITQGEQVAVLWPTLLRGGMKLRFAHRTFKWSNEGKGNAAVHCVIIGFGLSAPEKCWLWDYGDDPKGDGVLSKVSRLNSYLVEAGPLVIERRSSPLCAVPPMNYGSMPIDDGHLVLNPAERIEALSESATLKPYVRRYIGGNEFLNNIERYCFWFVDASPALIRASKFASERIRKTREFRLSSDREATQALAGTPQLFGEIRQPKGRYLVVPKVSSENRPIMPIGFEPERVIASGSALLVPQASIFHFAVLTSAMHMAWMRAVCGRLESRYQYSASIVYNNFPWPEPTATQSAAIDVAGQAVLDARSRYPESSLADLYDPLAMPTELCKAHLAVDKAVDAAYGYKRGKDDPARVAFLFELYERYNSLLPAAAPAKGRRSR